MTAPIRVCLRSKPVMRLGKLGGYAAVFGQPADLGWMGREEIAPGAFTRALKTSDVRALWNHDVLYVLGRQSASTLRLSQDSTGLEYEIDLPRTSYADDVRELVERGDVDGASFGFVPDIAEYDPGTGITRHTDMRKLIDVSVVTFPVYEGASAQVRSMPTAGGRRRSQLIRARAGVLMPRGGTT